MSDEKAKLAGPDLSQGVALSNLAEGAILLGHAQGESLILVRRGEELFAIGAACTHYGGALAEGLIVDDTVRCPWHHACFSLRSGEALRAPALNPVSCWRVEQAEWQGVCAGKAREREARAPPGKLTHAGIGRDRRWRRCGQRGCGNASPGRLRRSPYDAERGRLGAL